MKLCYMSARITIQGTKKSFGDDDVFIIAEIGKNFIQTEDDRSVEEYLENAKVLVDEAKKAGCDAVKFQTHELEDEILNVDIVSPHFKARDRVSWITRNMNATPLEKFWKPLKRHCDEKEIIFFSTPMSRKAARKLEQVGVPFWKVGSGDVQDYATLDFMIETGKPIIISTGMVGLIELDEVVEHITSRGAPLVILYCISQYPAPKEYFNLGTIEHFREKYSNVVIGFSDHSLGCDVTLAAVKLGANVIEKHFSHSRDLWGADHKVSMTPEEMKEMVDAIRCGRHGEIDHASYYGEKEKGLEGARNKFRSYFNKSLMAGANIPKGTIVTKEMIFAMRPKVYAGGLPAEKFHDVVGKRVKRDLKKYDPIIIEVLE